MNVIIYWSDAKSAAIAASLCCCHYAWITQCEGGYCILEGDSIDEAPANFVAEFIDGVEQ